MSLLDLTRNCFQNGISASKWIALCRLLLSKDTTLTSQEGSEHDISNSVLVLFRSFPGDPKLKEYLEKALQDGLLSLPALVTTFLQAAHSSELHNVSTLEVLCRVITTSHFASKRPPLGSIVALDDTPTALFMKISDAFALLHILLSMITPRPHPVVMSASELVILLLSCVGDMSQMSTQAMVQLPDTTELVQSYLLPQEVKQSIARFLLSLSIVSGDDMKVIRETQMIRPTQMAIGKPDVYNPSAQSDIMGLSLTLQAMLLCSGCDVGTGIAFDPVAILLALFRWTSWSPAAFYSQLFLSALTCFSQAFRGTSALWRAFIVGRLPRLIALFEKSAKSETSEVEWINALQVALVGIIRRSDLLKQCDHVLSQTISKSDDQGLSRPFIREVIQQLLSCQLIDHAFAVSMDPGISNSPIGSILPEAQESGMGIEAYFEVQLSGDTTSKEFASWLDRLWWDPLSHEKFADALQTRFEALASRYDAERLGELCKAMYLHEIPLRILGFHKRLSVLIFYGLMFLDQYNFDLVGDPQSGFGQLGSMILFIQATIARFHLSSDVFVVDGRSCTAKFLKTAGSAAPIEDLTEEGRVALTAWFKALFDPSSEGIDDTLLRSTKPGTLLRLVPILFEKAIFATLTKKIEPEVLNNGISYFLGPLLNWTLIGVVRYLVREIQRRGFNVQVHWHILYTLLSSPSCPSPVLCICGSEILRLFSHKRFQKDLPGMLARRKDAATRVKAALKQSRSDLSPDASWREQPGVAIRNALAMAQAGKAPVLDVTHCLTILTPSQFLHLLWAELINAVNIGDIEICQRILVFVLVIPRNGPSLLPVFLHNVLPAILSALGPQAAEQAMAVELTVGVVTSALSAVLHLERAYRTVGGETRPIVGTPSNELAKEFASLLKRGRKGGLSVCTSIIERMTAAKSFLANFPLFASDLN